MSSPSFDRNAVRAHIEMLHGLAKSSGRDGILVLARITADQDGTLTERFSIGDVDGMTNAIMALDGYPRLNLYAPWSVFQKHLPRGSRGKESHVAATLALVGDLDVDNGKPGQGLPLPAPYIVQTSADNSQPVFPLSRALAAAEAKPIAVALGDFIGADSRTKDISGLWRIPGTLNWPDKKKIERGRSPEPQLVKVAQAWTGELIEPEKLAIAVRASTRSNEVKRTNNRPISFQDLPATLKKLIAAAPFAGEDQSDTAAAVFSQLRRLGWDDTDIKDVVEAHPGGIGKRYAEGKKLEADLQRTGDKWGRPELADPVDLWAKFDPPSLPHSILPDVIERFAIDQGRAMGADISGVAVAALAVCAAAIPDKIQLQVKKHNVGWLESARLWVALVGPPSTMKSPIMSAVVRPLRRIDSDMARRYSEARGTYDKLPAEERKITDPPKQIRVLLQDTTIEAAQEIIKDSPDGLLCYQDEMSGWFGSMDKYSGARGSAKDRAFWLEAYNGAPYSVNRIGRGSVFIENLSVSILGGIQPEPIRKLADDSMDDGLLQRLIPIILQPAVEGLDEPASDDVADYAALVRQLHDLDNPMRSGGVLSGTAETLRFDDGAQLVRQELERKHLALQQIETINRKLAAHVGKYNGIFARLCVIWHCIDHADGRMPAAIAEHTAKRVATFLHSFLLPHALSFYAGTLGLSNDHDRLTSAAGYILAHKLDRLTNRDVQRGDRTMRGLDKRELETLLNQLDALGWINRTPATRPTDPPHWVVNPAVHVKFADRALAERERRARDRQTIAGLMNRNAA